MKKQFKLSFVSLAMMFLLPSASFAHGEKLLSACKSVCADAKSEGEAKQCVQQILKKKERPANWDKSRCVKAYKAQDH